MMAVLSFLGYECLRDLSHENDRSKSVDSAPVSSTHTDWNYRIEKQPMTALTHPMLSSLRLRLGMPNTQL
jgi:hypothetical protein